MLIPPRYEGGLTIIEIMIVLTIMGAALMLGLPSYTEWIQNTQIRTAAESMQAGIQVARNEALKRNETVRFQLTDTLDSSCAASTSGKNWVVSVNDASALCDKTDPEVDPFIVQKRGANEGSRNAAPDASQAVIAFSGLGMVTPTPAGTITIDVNNSTGGVCKSSGGAMRCLRIQVSPSGQLRLCDPSVYTTGDPRKC